LEPVERDPIARGAHPASKKEDPKCGKVNLFKKAVLKPSTEKRKKHGLTAAVPGKQWGGGKTISNPGFRRPSSGGPTNRWS